MNVHDVVEEPRDPTAALAVRRDVAPPGVLCCFGVESHEVVEERCLTAACWCWSGSVVGRQKQRRIRLQT
eukprot:1569294-Rhodomonas_salina.1